MIQLNSVYKTYGQGITSLSNINLAIKKGEFVFITGASGSGKTTLLKLLYCEERPTSGQILINRQAVDSLKISEIPYLRRRIGVIFQDFKLLSEKTIFDNVAIPLEVLGLPRGEVVKRVQDVLKKVRLHHRMEEKVSSLSGGEQQKVAVGRAIINDPMILLVDEPTGSLDSGTGDEIMEILRSVNARGTTAVIATHNRYLIKEGRAVVLEKGRIVS